MTLSQRIDDIDDVDGPEIGQASRWASAYGADRLHAWRECPNGVWLIVLAIALDVELLRALCAAADCVEVFLLELNSPELLGSLKLAKHVFEAGRESADEDSLNEALDVALADANAFLEQAGDASDPSNAGGWAVHYLLSAARSGYNAHRSAVWASAAALRGLIALGSSAESAAMRTADIVRKRITSAHLRQNA